ncbi:T9SS type A sorting domain-containing protein [bacterium]|nr:T9SS type A sorting domain-containing protein [bacterium]
MTTGGVMRNIRSAVLVLLSTSFVVCSQPVMRPGWPATLNPVGSVWSKNCLAVTATPAEGRIIAAATNLAVGVWDEDGVFFPGWPVALEYEEDGLIVSGPRLGNVTGDAAPEVVLRVAHPEQRTRLLVFNLQAERLPFEFDHSPWTPFPDTWPMGGHVLIDVDDDTHEEIFFIADTLLFGVNGDGSSLPGYPISAGEISASRNATPCFGIGDGWGGEPVVFWHTRTLIHGRYLETGESIPGYPIVYDGDYYSSPLTLIPRPNGWAVSLVDEDSLHAWNRDGERLEGFPVENPFINGESEAGYDVIASDIDGDDEPELFYSVFENFLYGRHLEGACVDGFPLNILSNGSAEPFVALRSTESDSGFLFGMCNGPNRDSILVHGFRYNETITGFPFFENMEISSRPYAQTAVFPPVEGSMILVTFNRNGFIAAFDVPVPEGDYRMEWPMPGHSPGGNRLYHPEVTSAVNDPTVPTPVTSTFAAVYPNPSNGSFRFRLRPDSQGHARIVIHDVLGRKVYDTRLEGGRGNVLQHRWNARLDGTSLSAGVYMVTLIGERTVTRKAVLLP